MEQAICNRYGRDSSPMLGLGRFHKNTIEKLIRRKAFFCRELLREVDQTKKIRLRKYIKELQRELRKLFLGWMRSSYRKRLIEKRETGFVVQQDKLLSRELNLNEDSDIERKYRKAGRIINRNKLSLQR